MNNLTLNDLPEGNNSLPITPAFLKRIIKPRMNGDRSLEGVLLAMAGLTSQTGREVSVIVYAKIPKGIEKCKSVNDRILAFPDFLITPSLGDFERVSDPPFYHTELYRKWIGEKASLSGGTTARNPSLVVPVIHVHTHPPGCESYTSEEDLRCARNKLLGIDLPNSFNQHLLNYINPTLNVIIGATTVPGSGQDQHLSFTFYQLTGDENAFNDFMVYYSDHKIEATGEAFKRRREPGYSITETFMKRLVNAGVAKYLHFPAISVSDNPARQSKALFQYQRTGRSPEIPKRHLDKIANKFAYQLRVERRNIHSYSRFENNS